MVTLLLGRSKTLLLLLLLLLLENGCLMLELNLSTPRHEIVDKVVVLMRRLSRQAAVLGGIEQLGWSGHVSWTGPESWWEGGKERKKKTKNEGKHKPCRKNML